MTDICLFPIPDCVTFPGTLFPLHVFEPRYRTMMYRALEERLPVAICHVEKQLSPSKPDQTLEEALNSNQATYRPQAVFSAGLCELKEITNDGRMYLNVHMQERYRAVEEKQTLPYMVWACEPFLDQPASADEHQQNLQLQEKILVRFHALAHRYPELQSTFPEEHLRSMSPEAFSFRLFGAISFGSELQQEILEMDSAHQRLTEALSLLNQV
ncbi:MAG: carboligase [Oceanospirillaceae bacterium]|nr:carboligase [Oceanospirillaceae bacterium]|tara:strand:+ start:1687 stop:2325 length:639 start_codon:yes stop_codon:yes gene_type:complete